MLRLQNTMTHSKEEFTPPADGIVRMYTCGPTVYRYAHIGNMRTYIMADGIRRRLLSLGFDVQHVKNITDVGHMRQDMVERGEDKMIAAALAEGKSLEQIADFYTKQFMEDEAKLHILPAKVFPRATQHVAEMIDVSEKLLANGYAYVVEGNVYFDVSKYPEYGKLSHNQLEGLMQGVRVEVDPLKRNQTDFALWKAAEPGRMVKWASPWGEGFPGWHIECSAMSTKYLGTHLDIHTGGVDNIFPHHEDELAQTEGAFGGPFVRYWVHGQHLLADSLKMAKSTGNSYTISELEERGFEAMAFRYLCLTAHYRARLNFTFRALRGAQHALAHLRTLIRQWSREQEPMSAEALENATEPWESLFWSRVDDDLNMPQAIGTIWTMAGSNIPATAKLALIEEFDAVLGLDLAAVARESTDVPVQIRQLVDSRATLRTAGQYANADSLRTQVMDNAYLLRDHRDHVLVLPSDSGWQQDRLVGTISSPSDVDSLLGQTDECEFSINILAHNYYGDVKRCVDSVLKWAGDHDIEIMIVDSSSTDETGAWADELASTDPRIRVIHTDHNVGEAPGRNIGLKQSRGKYILMLDTSIEFAGDALTQMAETLEDPKVGSTGGWGVSTEDLRHFESEEEGEVDAIEGYCLAFRREILNQVGLLDEKFRFYRNLDLDFGMALKNQGYSNIILPDLPLNQHEHRGWFQTDEEEREKLSRKNFYRFLGKWGNRTDLLVHQPSPPQKPAENH